MDAMRSKMELMWGNPIFYTQDENSRPVSAGAYQEEESPFLCSTALVETLISRAKSQDFPVIYKDEADMYYICLKTQNGFCMTGPVCTEEKSRQQLNRYYELYHMDVPEKRHPNIVKPLKIVVFAALLQEEETGKSVDISDILNANSVIGISEEAVDRDSVLLEMKSMEDEIYHHTYQEERASLECIRNGDVEKVSSDKLFSLMDASGRLSKDLTRHYRYLAIADITVFTREAIAGGVSPAEAYRISDVYINRLDTANEISEIMDYIYQAYKKFTEMVAAEKARKSVSGYTAQCKDYIKKNYYRKIRLEEIAEAIGVSAGHLSRVFKKETGSSISDYLLQVRVEKAADFLRFSDASLAEIGDWVGLNSQSHFSNVFKRFMGMTPGQYRKQTSGGDSISGKEKR